MEYKMPAISKDRMRFAVKRITFRDFLHEKKKNERSPPPYDLIKKETGFRI